MGTTSDRVVVGNNSSLACMHDAVVYALLKGTCDSATPWSRQGDVARVAHTAACATLECSCAGNQVRVLGALLDECAKPALPPHRSVGWDVSHTSLKWPNATADLTVRGKAATEGACSSCAGPRARIPACCAGRHAVIGAVFPGSGSTTSTSSASITSHSTPPTGR